MKRNLLFISRYPEIIDEFQGILEEKQIETAISHNVTDLMELLKQKEYQILVTDLNLDGYNGDKIISYVNQVFPNTICMLYTNSISAVQLGFYLNKRDVFRVFLRPVNFRQEFMQALEEAYELYDLKKHDRDSRQERRKPLGWVSLRSTGPVGMFCPTSGRCDQTGCLDLPWKDMEQHGT